MSHPASLRASRFTGCLLGGAAGDALGAPFEGLWAETIPDADELLADYAELEGFPRGQYTDDTQLTLATVESLVENRGLVYSDIARRIASLWPNDIIGPGGACTVAALNFQRSGDFRTCGAPAGHAGNGTAMRTAALGLWFLEDADALPDAVASISRITHQDGQSVAGGVVIAEAASRPRSPSTNAASSSSHPATRRPRADSGDGPSGFDWKTARPSASRRRPRSSLPRSHLLPSSRRRDGSPA